MSGMQSLTPASDLDDYQNTSNASLQNSQQINAMLPHSSRKRSRDAFELDDSEEASTRDFINESQDDVIESDEEVVGEDERVIAQRPQRKAIPMPASNQMPGSRTGPLLPAQFPQPLVHPRWSKYSTPFIEYYVNDGPRDPLETVHDYKIRRERCRLNMNQVHRTENRDTNPSGKYQTKREYCLVRSMYIRQNRDAASQHRLKITPGEAKYDAEYCKSFIAQKASRRNLNAGRRALKVEELRKRFLDQGLPVLADPADPEDSGDELFDWGPKGPLVKKEKRGGKGTGKPRGPYKTTGIQTTKTTKPEDLKITLVPGDICEACQDAGYRKCDMKYIGIGSCSRCQLGGHTCIRAQVYQSSAIVAQASGSGTLSASTASTRAPKIIAPAAKNKAPPKKKAKTNNSNLAGKQPSPINRAPGPERMFEVHDDSPVPRSQFTRQSYSARNHDQSYSEYAEHSLRLKGRSDPNSSSFWPPEEHKQDLQPASGGRRNLDEVAGAPGPVLPAGFTPKVNTPLGSVPSQPDRLTRTRQTCHNNPVPPEPQYSNHPGFLVPTQQEWELDPLVEKQDTSASEKRDIIHQHPYSGDIGHQNQTNDFPSFSPDPWKVSLYGIAPPTWAEHPDFYYQQDPTEDNPYSLYPPVPY